MQHPPRLVPLALLLFLALAVSAPPPGRAEPGPAPGDKERCPVCGMFVAKYQQWLARIRLADGATLYFDGVKDLMVCRLEPGACGLTEAARIEEIWVQDYYTLEWLDGRRAVYVIGSDVYGPMGHEFIPFAGREAAEAFRADHHGQRILDFQAIDKPLVDSLRAGGRMR